MLIMGCDHTAPDYGACDPDRPSETVSVASFDRTLAGMDASFQDVRAATEREFVASARVAGEAGDRERVPLSFSVHFDDEAVFIPASEGCPTDRLELSATTVLTAPDGASAEGHWDFSLSQSTAEELLSALEPQQAELVANALGLTLDPSTTLELGIGARFVSHADPSQPEFAGTATLMTRGGPNTASETLGSFTWGP